MQVAAPRRGERQRTQRGQARIRQPVSKPRLDILSLLSRNAEVQVAAHTSRLDQRKESEQRREQFADEVYSHYNYGAQVGNDKSLVYQETAPPAEEKMIPQF